MTTQETVAESAWSASPADDEVVRFEGVNLRFGAGARSALRNVSFTVKDGKFVSVIGPSGCGKSTILNICAGLLKQSNGSVWYRGKPIEGVNTDVGYITQDANLLPWLNVESNIGLALKIRGFPKKEQQERVAQWIDRVGLTGFERHFPRELSGGMQKRASIARALIYDPNILLMDEPFGPLDAITRLKLQQELLNLWQNQTKTVIFVTHDLAEAISLADQVVVMSKGPGTIKGILDVTINRPRDIVQVTETPEFSQLYKQLWELFRSEIE